MNQLPDRKQKLGVALGGGGAKGFAHIGVLKAFKDAGIEFDIVTGTSIGALVGAVYAAGNLDQLEERARNIGLTDIPLLLSPVWSRSGFFSGKNALEFLEDLLGAAEIEDLPKTFAAVSVDLRRGCTTVFSSGNLRHAVRASISIPGVFTPVQHGEQVLVDGGLIEPVPVEICRKLGADIVVAIDLFGPDGSDSVPEEFRRAKPTRNLWPSGLANALTYLHTISNKLRIAELIPPGTRTEESREKPGALSLIDILENTLALTQRQLTEYRLAEFPPDFLLQPPVADVGLLDFHRGEPVIELGSYAAKAALPRLQAALARRAITN